MKGLRIFSLVAIALSVAAITLAGNLAKAQPPFSGQPPRESAAATVTTDVERDRGQPGAKARGAAPEATVTPDVERDRGQSLAGGRPHMIAAGTVTADSRLYKQWNLYPGRSMTCVWNPRYNWYEITIPGVSYFYLDFATLVTAFDGGSATPVHVAGAVTDSVDGKLLVSPTDPHGNRVQGGFSFVVFQY